MAYIDNRGNKGAYTQAYYDQYESTISNGEARIPICICVDTSSSMNFLNNDPNDYEKTGNYGDRDGSKVQHVTMKPGRKPIRKMDRLHDVLKSMIIRMQANDIISKAAVICIISFDQFADCFIEFTDVSRIRPETITKLETGKDITNSSKGIDMALGRLDQLMSINSDAGNDRYAPILIFMSDGIPTDGNEADRASRLVRQRSETGELNVVPISICGNSEGDRWLRSMSRDSRVYHMDNEKEFNDVFSGITERIRLTTMTICADEDSYVRDADSASNGTSFGMDFSNNLDEFLYGNLFDI